MRDAQSNPHQPAGDAAPCWRLSTRGDRTLLLDRPRILAILNVTPDSFSDGGEYMPLDAAVARANHAAEEGAAMLDIGGESTRPGAAPVSIEQQINRVVPVIRAIRASTGPLSALPISVDTTRAEVAEAALDAGADAINDQSAGRDDEAMLTLAAKRGAGVILMHRLRPPSGDSYSTGHTSPPDYRPDGVVAFVRGFLHERAAIARRAGVGAEAIVLDPGLGFGKNVEQNAALVRAAPELLSLGYPVLCAASRKSFLSPPLNGVTTPPASRVAASVAVAVTQYLAGVRLFRVHDVAEHAQALAIAARIGR